MKRNTLIVLGVGCVTMIGVGAWMFRSPPPPKESIAAVAARTGDYAMVLRAIDAGQITAEEARVQVRQEVEHQTLARLDDFYSTADPKHRQAVLDKAIDDFEKYKAERRKRAATTGPAGTASRVDPRIAMAQWALSQPTATRARLAEFRVAVDKRRAERGLPGMFADGVMLPLGKP